VTRFAEFVRTILLAMVAWVALLFAATIVSFANAADAEDPLEWHRVSASDVVGKGWAETEQPFDRLPARAKSIVRPEVWELARHSAGLYVDVITDATELSARWSVTSERLAMPHMPASGVSGVDLYLQREGEWHFLGNGRPNEYPTNVAPLAKGLEPVETTYRIYFPLYNGVASLQIGVPKGAAFRIVPTSNVKSAPVVIYGTSITQGGCASRPGMSYPAILGRRMNIPVINLGFSGNGKSEPEVARLLSELKASAFVLDPLPNLFSEQVAELMPKFIELIRDQHPSTPILLMESPLFPNLPFSDVSSGRVSASNRHLRTVYEARVAAGDRHIWIMPACDFIAEGGEATVDGVHPTDVGFLKLADAVELSLRTSLGLAKE
jgi:hypothetical protein